ncbi:MAG: mannose-1-phosphate guanylyltransferase/mannose-6-phosphate isomerase [Syntrophobacteraceae bacterium]
MIIPVILAGGSGTRLWPYSRELYPKQLLPLVDRRTMLQNTVLRLTGIGDPMNPVIICNENHRFLIAEQLREINVKPESIVLEPVGRNTAPAVAVAALRAVSINPDAILLVLPADHHITDEKSFHEAVRTGARFARKRYMVTFGIVPDAPETGYGYIEAAEKIFSGDGNAQAFKIRRFIEKPDSETARKYLKSGGYLWNSGMFMFTASHILDELEKFSPEIVASCRAALERGSSDLDFFRLESKAFDTCPSNSIDYAVMEKTESGVMIPLAAGWNDLGSWDALWSINPKDDHQNVTVGDTLIQDVESSYILATSRLVAAIGVENHIIVETPDAVLISTRDRVQDVKLLVQRIKSEKREEALTHRKVYRPWGSYESINNDARFQVKRITIKPGAKLSLQKHVHRAEHWVVVRGTALVTRGDEQFLLKEDESSYIPLGVVHRLENPGKIPLEIIEVQSGSYLGEDDIERYEDIYGR